MLGPMHRSNKTWSSQMSEMGWCVTGRLRIHVLQWLRNYETEERMWSHFLSFNFFCTLFFWPISIIRPEQSFTWQIILCIYCSAENYSFWLITLLLLFMQRWGCHPPAVLHAWVWRSRSLISPPSKYVFHSLSAIPRI